MPNPRHLAVLAFSIAFAAASPARARLDDKGWAQAKRDLERALAAGDGDASVKAIGEVRADETARAVDLLVAAGTAERPLRGAVYDALLEALAAMPGEARARALEVIGKKPEPRGWPARSLLCEALGAAEGAEVTAALAERLRDVAAPVVTAAARALGRRKDAASVEALVGALGDLEVAKDMAWLDAREALTALTGEDFATAAEWRAWWDPRHVAYDPAKDRGSKKAPSLAAPGVPSFFGVPVFSKRPVFVIDASSDMKDADVPAEGGASITRFDAARREIASCLGALGPDARFDVIVFAAQSRPWRTAKQGLQPATPANKQDAIKWLGEVKPDGGAATDRALADAFDLADASALYLVSCGQPLHVRTTGRGKNMKTHDEVIDMPKLIDDVVDRNRLRRARLFTFYAKTLERPVPAALDLFDPAKFRDFMRDLAEKNGGRVSTF